MSDAKELADYLKLTQRQTWR